MPGESRIHVVKDPFPGHIGFAAAPFFGRAAVNPDRPLSRLVLQIVPQQKAGPYCRRAQKAVPAAMAIVGAFPGTFCGDPRLLGKPGQGIVFCQNGNHRFAAAIFCHIGCGHMGQSPGYPEAFLFQQFRHGSC